MKKKLQVGIIGLGMVSENHINGYYKIRDLADIAAVCDVREEIASDAAKRIGAKRYYTDYHKFLADEDIEAVDILLPHYLHEQVAIDAAEAGKDILIEKPIARDSVEGQAISNAAKRSKVRVMVANNLLFHPAAQRASRLIADGHLGKLSLAKAWSLGWFLYNVGITKYRRSARQTGGGCLIDTGTHFVYLLRNLVGDVRSVSSYNANILNKLHESVDKVDFVPEGEDTSVTLLEFRDGALGELTVSYSTKLQGWEKFWPYGWDQKLQIYGSKGAIIVDLPTSTLTLFSEKKGKYNEPNRTTNVPVELDYGASFDREVRHFVECLVNDRDFMKGVQVTEAVKDMKVIEAAYRSAREKKKVRIA